MPGTVCNTSRSDSKFCCWMLLLLMTVMVCGVSTSGAVYFGDAARSTFTGDSVMAVSVTVMPPSFWPCSASCAPAEVATAMAPTQDKARYAGFPADDFDIANSLLHTVKVCHACYCETFALSIVVDNHLQLAVGVAFSEARRWASGRKSAPFRQDARM